MRALFALVLVSCVDTTRLRIQETQDRRTLNDAVAAYWQAVRWTDPPAVAAFFERPEDQLTVTRAMAEGLVRLNDVQILLVTVGPPLDATRRPFTREGVAAVRIEGLDGRTSMLTATMIEQHWHLAGNRWTIDPATSPPHVDRPW